MMYCPRREKKEKKDKKEKSLIDEKGFEKERKEAKFLK
jgi:hypothetical protein